VNGNADILLDTALNKFDKAHLKAERIFLRECEAEIAA